MWSRPRAIGIREVIWKPQTIGEMGDLLAQQLQKLVSGSPPEGRRPPPEGGVSGGAPLKRPEGVSQP